MKSLKKWCFENNCVYILEQWLEKENMPLTPENISYGSEKIIKWECQQCHYKWERKLNLTTSGKRGCPKCAKNIQKTKTLETKIRKNGSFAEKFPELLQFWDTNKNNISPYKVTPKSNQKVWWICKECKESYFMSVGSKANGNGCPKCKSKNRIKTLIKKNGSLFDKAPFLEKEWLSEKNNNISIKDITPNSNKKYYWKCSTCNYEWQASASTRLKGHGCPVCSGLIATKSNNLAAVAPDLAKEWHPTKNGNLKPEDVKPYSDKKVWWICNRGHEWQASVSNRFQGRNCKKCSSELRTSFPEQCFLYYLSKYFKVDSRIKINDWEIDIYLCDYSIAIEYDGIAYHNRLNLKNREIRKNDALKKAGIFLIRIKEDYKMQKIDNDVIYFKVDHKYSNLESALQLLFKLLSKYIRIDFHDVNFNINRDRHEIYNNYISYEKKNNFENKFPDLVKFWNYEKNNNLKPSMFSYMSNKIIWWKCPICKGEWEESIINVSKGNRCPYCSNHRVLKGFNDFETLYPELAKEWNYKKNLELRPYNCTSGSNKKVWWRCSNNHEWRATIARRVKNPECPYCSGKHKIIPLKKEQWMKKYSYAKKYFIENGSLDIPANYITKDGIKLGSWIRTQRVCYKNNELTEERIQLLESINMLWNAKLGSKKKNK